MTPQCSRSLGITPIPRNSRHSQRGPGTGAFYLPVVLLAPLGHALQQLVGLVDDQVRALSGTGEHKR